MSFPVSATEAGLQARVADLLAAGSLEISPRELHRAGEVAALLPADTCVYIPSLPGLPLARTLEAVAAIRTAGLDPVPHVSARRILNREEFRDFIASQTALGRAGSLLINGDLFECLRINAPHSGQCSQLLVNANDGNAEFLPTVARAP